MTTSPLTIRFLLLCLIGLIFMPSGAHALSCVKPPSYARLPESEKLRRRMRYADAVFAARFKGSDVESGFSMAQFEVLRVWKGRVAAAEQVRWQPIFSDPPRYAVGEVYVVFASGSSRTLQNNIEECDPLIHVELKNNRLQYPTSLGMGRRPRA
jgi:hypothetical protein